MGKYLKAKDQPGIIYVSKISGEIYKLKNDGAEIDLETPLPGINLMLYKYVGQNNNFKIYHLKK
jgi:hypothetical protein